MSNHSKDRGGGRKFIITIITVAVIALCLMSSLQDKYGSDFGLPAMKGFLSILLEEFGIDTEGLFETSVQTEAETDSSLKVHFIDVGQAKAILIQAPDSTVLIDSGDNETADLLPSYLKRAGVDTIDLLIATHPHADHIGGMDRVVQGFDIGEVIMPDIPMAIIPTTATFTRLLQAIDTKGLSITSAKPGKSYDLGDGAILQILAPVESYDDLNNISISARLEYRQISFLFTGDIESQSERDILSSGRDIRSDVLDVAHHGSNSSSVSEFLKAVSPEIAVISCGIDNSYGHPHREPMERLENMDIKIYRTDLDGTVIISTDGLALTVDTEK